MHSSQREEEAQYAGENLANIEGQRYEDAVKLVTSGGDGHEVAVDVDSLRIGDNNYRNALCVGRGELFTVSGAS